MLAARRAAAALLLALALALAACGGDDAGGARELPTVDLSLDFVPNAVHAPIYEAVRNGHDREEGIRLQIHKPGSGPDALKLVAGGRLDLGVLDIHDLAIARERGADLVAIGALVGRPLAALIARPDIARPRDLEGGTVGVSGLPSDPAFLRAILAHDGARYRRVRAGDDRLRRRQVLLTGRVDAVPAFWNAEGVALKQQGLPVREFRVEDYGAPPYPEVILMTSRRTLEQHRDRLRRALLAIQDGLHDTLADPEAAAREIDRAAETRDVALTRAQLRAVSRASPRGCGWTAASSSAGRTSTPASGSSKQRPDVDRAFDFSLLARG